MLIAFFPSPELISAVILLVNTRITYWIWCMKKSGNFCLHLSFGLAEENTWTP